MSEQPLPPGEATFRVAEALEAIRRQWPVARLESHAVGAGKDLTSDVLWAEPLQPEHWLVLTSGLHGIEGGLGAVMLDLFVREFAPRLDPRTTGKDAKTLLQELLHNFEPEIESINLVPSDGGCFEVEVNGSLLFSKLETKSHVEPGEGVGLVGKFISQ